MVMGDYGDQLDEDEDESEEEDDEEEDRSLDLLVRFVESAFRKVSRKVGFAVNGTIILSFLWVLRAFLEVTCTVGSVVFASILLIRGIRNGISYFQDSRAYKVDEDEPQSWTTTRPAT